MNKSLLQEILNIEGVEGAFIASNKAEIYEKLGLKYRTEKLKSLSYRMLRMIAVFHRTGKRVTELELYWQNYYVICRNSDQFILVTFCSAPRLLSLLRITLNVIMSKLFEDKKLNKWLKNHKADKITTLRSGNFDEAEKKMISKLK